MEGIGAAAGAGFDAIGAGDVAGFASPAVVADLAGFATAGAYQSFTPLCPLHAPDLLAAVLYVPSLHIPVEPEGAPAGACAIIPCETTSPANTTMHRMPVVIDILTIFVGSRKPLYGNRVS